MIKSLLARDEGKTLEFKRNCSSLVKIVQNAVAFANTAGGTLVIGIQVNSYCLRGVSMAFLSDAVVLCMGVYASGVVCCCTMCLSFD